MKQIWKECMSLPKTLQTAVCCVIALVSMVYAAFNGGELFDYFYCLATIPFVCLPMILSLLFRWNFHIAAYSVFTLYAMGPIVGAVYDVYYHVSWWDDLLHILAGVIFAVCGTYLVHAVNKGNKTTYLLNALFGFMVSVTIAVIWEIFEFSSDMLLGSDMQADTIINAVITKVGRTDGGVTAFENISEVIIDGKKLGLGGYLDIGLIDTMQDMIVETVGALVYFFYAIFDRERHPLIRKI